MGRYWVYELALQMGGLYCSKEVCLPWPLRSSVLGGGSGMRTGCLLLAKGTAGASGFRCSGSVGAILVGSTLLLAFAGVACANGVSSLVRVGRFDA